MDNNIYRSVPVSPSEITPESVYLSRRKFMQLGGIALSAALLAACETAPAPTQPAGGSANPAEPAPNAATNTDELKSPLTSFDDITNYINYYEFSTDKGGVASRATKLTTTPWTIEVGGLVRRPKTYGIEDLQKKFSDEERIYRLRCVEGWSMVIPWLGFPLAQVLKEVEPTGNAKFVRFETLLRPSEMPNQRSPMFPWPYQEGLRLDEALNDLTILSTGLYGKSLLPQNGAPIRLVVPWKYGFKSIKSIVKIELVEKQPATLWSTTAPDEYGFYSNVNPNRSHPRWSQATERRIGELLRRPTLMFNGYGDQVADMYAGMNLMQDY